MATRAELQVWLGMGGMYLSLTLAVCKCNTIEYQFFALFVLFLFLFCFVVVVVVVVVVVAVVVFLIASETVTNVHQCQVFILLTFCCQILFSLLTLEIQ